MVDELRDLVADLADPLERLLFWVRQLPADVALVRNHRAGIVTGRNDDVRPLDDLVIELARHVVVAHVDADLGERRQHLRVDGGAGVGAG